MSCLTLLFLPRFKIHVEMDCSVWRTLDRCIIIIIIIIIRLNTASLILADSGGSNDSYIYCQWCACFDN